MNKSTAESSNELLTPQLPIIRYFFEKDEQVIRYYCSSFCLSYGYLYLVSTHSFIIIFIRENAREFTASFNT